MSARRRDGGRPRADGRRSGRIALRIRQMVAAGALAALAWLIVTAPAPSFPGETDLRSTLIPLLLPLSATLAGIVAGWWWSRWLGLSAAFAVLPWAMVLVADPFLGGTRSWVVLLAALSLIVALTGRTAFSHFEGRSQKTDWTGRRMALVRWTLILSLAGVFNFYLFATAYTPVVRWHSLIPGGLALGLVIGVWLLARQRTLGLLVLAVCCLLLPPTSIYFVLEQPAGQAERILFGALFVPGWLAGVATLAAFAGPMRRFLRS